MAEDCCGSVAHLSTQIRTCGRRPTSGHLHLSLHPAFTAFSSHTTHHSGRIPHFCPHCLCPPERTGRRRLTQHRADCSPQADHPSSSSPSLPLQRAARDSPFPTRLTKRWCNEEATWPLVGHAWFVETHPASIKCVGRWLEVVRSTKQQESWGLF